MVSRLFLVLLFSLLGDATECSTRDHPPIIALLLFTAAPTTCASFGCWNAIGFSRPSRVVVRGIGQGFSHLRIPTCRACARARARTVYVNASERRVYPPDLAYDMALCEFSKSTRLVCRVLLSARGWRTCGNDNAQCANKIYERCEGEAREKGVTRGEKPLDGLDKYSSMFVIVNILSVSIVRNISAFSIAQIAIAFHDATLFMLSLTIL